MIDIYTETMPRDGKNAKSGLDILIEPIALGLGVKFSKVLYLNVYGDDFDEFPALFENKFIKSDLENRGNTTPQSYIPRLTGDETVALDRLASQKTSNSHILFLVAADMRFLLRANYLATRTRSRYFVYFVDDPKSSLRVKRAGNIRYLLFWLVYRSFVKGAAVVFSHTKSHVVRLRAEFSREVYELPLPWFPKQCVGQELQSSPKLPQLFYLGSVNYLYESELLEFSDAILTVNKRHGLGLKMITTSELKNVNSEHVITRRLSPEQIRDVVRTSLYCVLVYTKNKKYRDIVTNSFPSKIFQYIPLASGIIYFGPSGHELTDLAEKSGGYIRSVSHRAALEELLANSAMIHDRDSMVIQSEFKKLFTFRHSVENFGAIINRLMS